MKYLGNDKVCPPDWLCSVVTIFMIVLPSLFVGIFTIFQLCGKVGGAILVVLYGISLLNLLRIHHLCRNTEPGIVPNIRSKRIDYNKQYYVKYRELNDVIREFTQSSSKPYQQACTDAFYSTRHFELVKTEAASSDA